jgi:hypothetical protein
MYYGQRNVRMYDPGDIKKISWDVGSHGADVGKEMTKASNTLDEQDARAQQEHDMGMQQSMYQAAHERNLQAAEQQRRAYDSQTARDAQQRKFSVLDGLRGAMFRG